MAATAFHSQQNLRSSLGTLHLSPKKQIENIDIDPTIQVAFTNAKQKYLASNGLSRTVLPAAAPADTLYKGPHSSPPTYKWGFFTCFRKTKSPDELETIQKQCANTEQLKQYFEKEYNEQGFFKKSTFKSTSFNIFLLQELEELLPSLGSEFFEKYNPHRLVFHTGRLYRGTRGPDPSYALKYGISEYNLTSDSITSYFGTTCHGISTATTPSLSLNGYVFDTLSGNPADVGYLYIINYTGKYAIKLGEQGALYHSSGAKAAEVKVIGAIPAHDIECILEYSVENSMMTSGGKCMPYKIWTLNKGSGAAESSIDIPKEYCNEGFAATRPINITSFIR